MPLNKSFIWGPILSSIFLGRCVYPSPSYPSRHILPSLSELAPGDPSACHRIRLNFGPASPLRILSVGLTRSAMALDLTRAHG